MERKRAIVEHCITVTAYDNANDSASRRTLRIDSAPALSVTNAFDYNIRAEVTNAVMGTSTYGYGYDDIGNRQTSSVNAVSSSYTANNLNQYTAIAGAMACSPTFDLDGNMTWDGKNVNSWDGENRLIRSEPGGIATNGAVLVENGYDYQNRRFKKTVKQLSGRDAGYPMDPEASAGAWGVIETRKYIWDNWNIAAEIIVNNFAGTTNINYNTWGLDLSGSLQGAGGVGGLLVEFKDGVPYCPGYDANGNVTEYVDANGTEVAHREYSAFGQTTTITGPLANGFTFWWSTKPLCPLTGLSEYELRKYHADLACWLSRDPVEEKGGVNLYGFVSNNPINKWDLLGLKTISVPKCQGRLILGHTSERNPIHWEFPDGCAYGGVVGCWPGQNNPTNQVNRWPNVPTHNQRMFEGILKRLFGGTSLQYVDFSTDYIGGEEQEPDFTKAVENALSQTSFNSIVDNLCGSSCCCDEIVLTIQVTKGGWEIENGVEPHSLKPGMTVTVKGKCPSRKK